MRVVRRHRVNNTRTILLIALVLFLLAAPLSGQNLKKGNLPQFEDHPVTQEFHGKPVPVDLSSHPNARTFRTRLKEGAKKGANFDGHYALVFWGCGNECQQSLLVDLHTGRVHGVAEPTNNGPLESSRGIDFRLTSKLIIVDPPCPEDYNPCVSFGRSEEPVRYYLMENNGLRLIQKTPCKLINERQKCGP